ncbi:MAG: hypothetical protein MRJ68_19160 [Nitrospira sp.]|nr:hypothetical protein [Nitrospira sp.]
MNSKLINTILEGPSSPLARFELRCDPLTLGLASVGMSAGQAGMDIYGQFVARDTHNAQEEARRIEQQNAIDENRRRATHDYLTNTRLERLQQQQEVESVAQKTFDIGRESDRSVATSLASAAERGVAGRTVDQIASDFEFMASEETGRLLLNQKRANQQHSENVRAAGTEWQNRVTSIKPYIKQPAKPIDFFGPIFKAGSEALQTIGTGALTGPGFGAQASGQPNPGAQKFGA